MRGGYASQDLVVTRVTGEGLRTTNFVPYALKRIADSYLITLKATFHFSYVPPLKVSFLLDGLELERGPWYLTGHWPPSRYGSLYVPLAIGVSNPRIVRST